VLILFFFIISTGISRVTQGIEDCVHGFIPSIAFWIKVAINTLFLFFTYAMDNYVIKKSRGYGITVLGGVLVPFICLKAGVILYFKTQGRE